MLFQNHSHFGLEAAGSLRRASAELHEERLEHLPFAAGRGQEELKLDDAGAEAETGYQPASSASFRCSHKFDCRT